MTIFHYKAGLDLNNVNVLNAQSTEKWIESVSRNRVFKRVIKTCQVVMSRLQNRCPKQYPQYSRGSAFRSHSIQTEG